MSSSEDRQLREALHLRPEKVRSTKAAFYLMDRGGSFRLAAQDGFPKTAKAGIRSDPELALAFRTMIESPWI